MSAPGVPPLRMLSRDVAVAMAVPCLVALLVGISTIGGGFVFDDGQIVRDNPRLGSFAGIPALFVQNYWGEYADAGLYRPLTLATFSLEAGLFGQDSAWPFHATNVLLYALGAAAVGLLGLRLRLSPVAAAAAGSLFAAHPVHVEPVAGLVGRAELGAGLGVVVALIIALSTGRGWRPASAFAAVSIAALFFKESALAIVPLLALLPLWTSPETPWASTLKDGFTARGARWACLAVGVLIWLVLRSVALDGARPDPIVLNNVLAHRDATARVLGALEVSLRYFSTLVWPWPPTPDASYPAVDPSGGWALASVAALLWTGLGIAGPRFRGALAPVGLGLSLIFWGLLPVSNILFPIGTVYAERLLYLPSVGACLVVATLLDRAPKPVGPRLLIIAAAFMSTLGAVGFVTSARHWKNELTLAEEIVRREPRSAKGQSKLGYELFRAAQKSTPPDPLLLARAREHLERARDLYDVVDAFVDTHINLALVYSVLGEFDLAEEAAQEVKRRLPGRWRPYVIVAAARSQRGRIVEAIETCHEALSRNATGTTGDQEQFAKLVRIHDQCLGLLLGNGRFQEATSAAARAMELRPQVPDYVGMRIQALAQGGDTEAALREASAILAMTPADPRYPSFGPRMAEFYNQRGMVWKERSDLALAEADFTAAIDRAPGNLVPRMNRAEVRIERGDFDGANEDLEFVEAKRPGATAALRRRMAER